MVVTFCSSCYTDELLEEYPFMKNVKIYTADPYDFQKAGLPVGVVGATNRIDKVYIRRDLSRSSYDEFLHVLFHEAEHFRHPRWFPEWIIDLEAGMKVAKKKAEKLFYIV